MIDKGFFGGLFDRCVIAEVKSIDPDFKSARGEIIAKAESSTSFKLIAAKDIKNNDRIKIDGDNEIYTVADSYITHQGWHVKFDLIDEAGDVVSTKMHINAPVRLLCTFKKKKPILKPVLVTSLNDGDVIYIWFLGEYHKVKMVKAITCDPGENLIMVCFHTKERCIASPFDTQYFKVIGYK